MNTSNNNINDNFKPYVFTKTDLEELGLELITINYINFAMKLIAANRKDFMYKMREYIKNTSE